MFRLNRNERSHWSGNGVHVESELVFMIYRNMQEADTVRGVLGEMHPVTPDSLHFVKAAPSNSWVLKTKEKEVGIVCLGQTSWQN